MIRGLYVIVEGHTEEEFVNSSLQPYFSSNGIFDVRAIKIQTSPGQKGGDLKYDRYKPTIFVAETKSTTDKDKLRKGEQQKIQCGERHFEVFEEVNFKQVTKVSELL